MSLARSSPRSTPGSVEDRSAATWSLAPSPARPSPTTTRSSSGRCWRPSRSWVGPATPRVRPRSLGLAGAPDELDPQSLAAVVEIFERRRWLPRLMETPGAYGRRQLGRDRDHRVRERPVQPRRNEPCGGGVQAPRAAFRCRQPDWAQAHGLRRRDHHGPVGGGRVPITEHRI